MTQPTTYKKTNIPWMEKIPENWSFIRLKNIGFMYGGLSGKSGKDFLNEEYFNSYYIPFTSICNDINVKSKELKQVVIDENENQNKVEKYDLFFLMSSENFDDIGKTAILLEDLEEVYLNSFCKGFRVTNKSISPLFLNYCLNSTFYRQFLSTKGRGFTRINIRKNSVMSFGIKFPPYHLQLTINNYLDSQVKKIKTFITKKQTFIKLLKEQRQAIINVMVSGKLLIVNGKTQKPTKTKDSGIDWLGDIPEHWEVRRLKNVCKITTGGRNTEDRVDNGEYPFFVRSQTVERINSYSFDGVGILTAGDGVGVGKVFHLVNEKFDFHQRVYLFYDMIEKIFPEFLVDYLRFNLIKDLMRYNAKSTVDSVRLPILK